MRNILSLRFLVGPTKQGIIGRIQGARYPEILVAVVTALGVPVEEALSGIIMNSMILVDHLECDCE